MRTVILGPEPKPEELANTENQKPSIYITNIKTMDSDQVYQIV